MKTMLVSTLALVLSSPTVWAACTASVVGTMFVISGCTEVDVNGAARSNLIQVPPTVLDQRSVSPVSKLSEKTSNATFARQ